MAEALRKDFVSSNGRIWIQVYCHDERGDPYPPDNYRAELSIIDNTGRQCMRVNEAYKEARRIARQLRLRITKEGKEREALNKKWAKETFGIEW